MRPVKSKNTEFVNESITQKEILLIDDEGNKLGVIPRDVALKMASDKGLDLVLVSPDAKPAVGKLLDYSKFRYEQQKKQREMKKNQKTVQIKEIRLSPTIDRHDFETKAKQTIKFIEKGDKVKISIRFFGRMITHTDVGMEVMNEFITFLGDKVNVEARPKMDGRQLIAVVIPTTSK